MGFRIFGDDRDRTDIVVSDFHETLITSLQRQNELFTNGYQFEASLSRAALIEGLLLHYLLVAKQVDLIVFDDKTNARLVEERLTFGQINTALAAAGARHHEELAKGLAEYIPRRNHLAHHVVAGREALDFRRFHADGESLAWRLWQHILTKTAPHRPANP
jgi:hypothetical protein